MLAGQVVTSPNPDPLRFEKDIAAFEAEDRASPPRDGGVVFVGSSSVRYWDTARAFPELPTIKRGFGGSHISDHLHYADRTIVAYHPKVVVFYAGDADVAGGKNAARIVGDMKMFVAAIHGKLPKASLVIIGIKPSPAHWAHIDTIRAANALIQAEFASDPRVTFVDVAGGLLGRDGRPRAELYAPNGLNLNEIGYAAWTDATRPVIERVWNGKKP